MELKTTSSCQSVRIRMGAELQTGPLLHRLSEPCLLSGGRGQVWIVINGGIRATPVKAPAHHCAPGQTYTTRGGFIHRHAERDLGGSSRRRGGCAGCIWRWSWLIGALRRLGVLLGHAWTPIGQRAGLRLSGFLSQPNEYYGKNTSLLCGIHTTASTRRTCPQLGGTSAPGKSSAAAGERRNLLCPSSSF